MKRWVPCLRALAAIIGLAALGPVTPFAAYLRSGAAAHAESPAPAMPSINDLWREQPQRMAMELSGLQARLPGRVNVYAIAVAAQGSQRLFSSEARLALQVVSARFGTGYRGGMLLSNAMADLPDHPLATQDSLGKAAAEIGARIDPRQDLVVIYLASHGAPQAWIATDLPSKATFPPISAEALAASLATAGIRRRVVVISACFAASWIPALASEDTIVIAAAARDRTSFGCDDRRRLTWFGEAFLEGPLARRSSLRNAFDTARTTVARWESNGGYIPSMPEASVGRNLQALWNEAPAALNERRRASGSVP